MSTYQHSILFPLLSYPIRTWIANAQSLSGISCSVSIHKQQIAWLAHYALVINEGSIPATTPWQVAPHCGDAKRSGATMSSIFRYSSAVLGTLQKAIDLWKLVEKLLRHDVSFRLVQMAERGRFTSLSFSYPSLYNQMFHKCWAAERVPSPILCVQIDI